MSRDGRKDGRTDRQIDRQTEGHDEVNRLFFHDRANIPEINNTLTNGILNVFPQKNYRYLQ